MMVAVSPYPGVCSPKGASSHSRMPSCESTDRHAYAFTR